MRRKRCEERGDEGEKGKVGRKRWERWRGRERWGKRDSEKEVARERKVGRKRWGERGWYSKSEAKARNCVDADKDIFLALLKDTDMSLQT